MSIKKVLFLFFISISVAGCAQDKNPVNNKNTHEVIVKDLNNPWGFTFLPDASMLNSF